MHPSLEILQARAALLAQIRDYFACKNVLEVTTSVLSQAAVTDPAIESFCIPGTFTSKRSRYLRTSPEFAMKRLLCAGAPDIYEIGPVFRQGEQGAHHNPEFHMLEWYRRGYTMLQLINEVIELVQLCSAGHYPNLCVERYTYKQLFLQVLKIDIDGACDHTLGTLAHQLGSAPDTDLDKDQWLDFLFASYVQPTIKARDIVVVSHYPASQAALARLDHQDKSVALRFEVFVHGVELANGYEELCNESEQRHRFALDNQIRTARKLQKMPLDQLFLDALSQGLPPCSGVALGIERLLMFVHDIDNMSETLVWPWNSA